MGEHREALFTLFTVRETVKRLLKDRDLIYVVNKHFPSTDQDQLTFNVFSDISTRICCKQKGMNVTMALSLIAVKNKSDVLPHTLVVFNNNCTKVDVSFARNLNMRYPNVHILLAIKGPITSFARAALLEQGNEIFSFDELSFYLPAHVPKHRALSIAEVQKLMARYKMVEKRCFPEISKSDAVVKWYNFSVDVVVEITRVTQNGEKYFYYRRVVK